MQSKKVDDIEDFLIEKFNKHWKNHIDGFVISESTDVPCQMLTIEFKIYQFYPIRLHLELGTISFSIIFSNTIIGVFESKFSFENIDQIIEKFDSEIRLRIPDKFLIAKGW